MRNAVIGANNVENIKTQLSAILPISRLMTLISGDCINFSSI